eukprot:scaffold13930_cov65-Phaeocystis_antarctica.AAC.2
MRSVLYVVLHAFLRATLYSAAGFQHLLLTLSLTLTGPQHGGGVRVDLPLPAGAPANPHPNLSPNLSPNPNPNPSPNPNPNPNPNPSPNPNPNQERRAIYNPNPNPNPNQERRAIEVDGFQLPVLSEALHAAI